MCSPARCRACQKVTWRGCGRHVQAVLAHVPEEERCRCQPDSVKPASFVMRLRRNR